MNLLLDISIISVLARTMGNTAIWGSIIILLTFILLHLNREKAPSWKTKWIFGAMLSLIALMAAFFYSEMSSALEALSVMHDQVTLANHGQMEGLTVIISDAAALNDYKDVLIWTWFLGALVLLVRFILNHGYAHYVRRSAVCSDSPDIYVMITNIADKLSYNSHRLKLGFSKIIDSPMVIGFAKPIILFPIGLMNQLSPAEVESIIAHEIAHLARRDHLISGVMVFLEVVLYFHPGVWWLNAQMKKFREEDCDDRAIAVTGDELTYVKTLVKLKEYNKHTPNDLMLALNGGNKSNFYNRIKRLLKMDVKSKSIKGQLFVLSSIILLGLFLTSSTMLAQDHSEDETAVEEKIEDLIITTPEPDTEEAIIAKKSEVAKDTIPKKDSYIKIDKKDNKERVELEMKNGEIVELKINGEVIEEEDYDEHDIIINELKGGISNHGKGLFFSDEESGLKRFKIGDDQVYIFGDNDQWPQGLNNSINGRLDSILSRFPISDSTFRFSYDEFPSDLWNSFPDMNTYFFSEDGMEQFELSKDLLQEYLNSAEQFQFPNGAFKAYGFDSDGSFEFDGNRFKIFESDDHFNWFENDADNKLFDRSERNLESLIGSQLNKDGFLIPNKENKVLLTGKYLKINGEKQPSNIWNKYKRLFENETGVPLHKKSRLEFSIIGKESNKRYKAF